MKKPHKGRAWTKISNYTLNWNNKFSKVQQKAIEINIP